MSMLTERLQVLIETGQRDRLEREAVRRGTSVATLVREAIEHRFPSSHDRRSDAAARILAAPLMDVPDPHDLHGELAAVRSLRR